MDQFIKHILFAVTIATLFLSGCKNALTQLDDTNSDDAIYYSAQQDMNAMNYNSAIAKLSSLSSGYQQKRNVVVTTSSAYAGRCGLNFINLANSLSNISTQRLFPLLLGQFTGATTSQISDCIQAETTLRGLIPSPGTDFTTLSADENVLLAMISMAKVGVILSTYADLNKDGVADMGFDSCSTAQLPAADLAQIATGLNLALAALPLSGITQADQITGQVSAACTIVPGYNFCGIYNTAAIVSPMTNAVGGLIKTQDYVGLGTCANTLANCICP